MSMSLRPRIAIPARLAESSSVTRYEAIVTARKLAELIWDAGGEPLSFLPVKDANWEGRLEGIQGILMPGGADVDPQFYGQDRESQELYGINSTQDESDISLVNYALTSQLPFFTICRGTQIANVALGGTLIQHMDEPHISKLSTIEFSNFDADLGISDSSLTVSCFHHQSIDSLAQGVAALAHADEGHIEAVRYPSDAWAFGVQWHPEDNYKEVQGQMEIVKTFINAARG
jgi:putative glutamine amidotransferase